jgi:hypothetical protein
MDDNLFKDLLPNLQGDTSEHWEKQWVGMPEFKQMDLEPFKSIQINFESESDMLAFSRLVDQKITFKTPSIWYPKAERLSAIDKLWVDKNNNNE